MDSLAIANQNRPNPFYLSIQDDRERRGGCVGHELGGDLRAGAERLPADGQRRQRHHRPPPHQQGAKMRGMSHSSVTIAYCKGCCIEVL